MNDENNGIGAEGLSDGEDTEYLDRSEPRSTGDRDLTEPHERVEGSTASQRYLLGETLGEGGMAIVQQATDVQLRRSVAVKRLRNELAHRDDARQRFFAEAEILAGLDHPGTTAVYDAGRLADGDCFYAMKKVKGRTLRELMDERISEDFLDRADRAHYLEIFIRLCQTVAAAHQQGIIHRDLKPENIMVDELGVVYVMDWGLAKQLVEEDDPDQSDSGRTQLGAIMGTPAYMSPEQASGHGAESDRQTDVFSLGVMLYEILTGVNPFRGSSAVDSMKGVMYHNPESPRSHNPRVDRTISAITMKALDKDPFKRYRSAVELAEDVRHYREYLPVAAIDQSRLQKLANWSRRRPRLATTVATLAVVSVMAFVVAAFEASLEQARLARGYRILDEIESDLSRTSAEIDSVNARMREAPGAAEAEQLSDRLATLEAAFDAAEDERKTTAVAITGYTLLSPDDRATSAVRDATLDEINTLIERGSLHRARAEIRVALRYAGERNLFGFTEGDVALLQTQLVEVERRLEESRRIPSDPLVTSLEENHDPQQQLEKTEDQ